MIHDEAKVEAMKNKLRAVGNAADERGDPPITAIARHVLDLLELERMRHEGSRVSWVHGDEPGDAALARKARIADALYDISPQRVSEWTAPENDGEGYEGWVTVAQSHGALTAIRALCAEAADKEDQR